MNLKKLMKRLSSLSVLALLALSLAVFVGSPPVHSAGSAQATASINVSKSTESLSLDNRVPVVLTIVNNGTVPVFDLEIYEYMNGNLKVEGSILIIAPWGRSQVTVAPGQQVSVTQVIVDPTPPNALAPGQHLVLRYTQVAPRAGDFQVPTSLVWYSYKYGDTTIRTSIYSNGLMLHVLNDVEKAVFQIYPYMLSATAFTSTFAVLFWVRGRLAKLKKSRL